jgi:hypothetical protein
MRNIEREVRDEAEVVDAIMKRFDPAGRGGMRTDPFL